MTQRGHQCSYTALSKSRLCRRHRKIYGGGVDLLYPLKKGFQIAANAYRKVACQGRARPLELGEFHFGCHQFTGPGTKIDKYRNAIPYNDIDNCSRTHDIEYEEADREPDKKKRERLIREADLRAIECYDKYPKENGYLAARAGINGKVHFEKILPTLAKSIAPTYFGSRYRR